MSTGHDEVAIGAVLAGKYRVDRILGEGGMGIVVAATHVQLDEPVAMKFLHARVAKEPDLVARFQREAKAARKIKSEHVVRILDVGTLESGSPFMVMEYLEGTDLLTLIGREGPQSVANAVDYVLQACEALAEAHVQGMVHRDLKPANLFVTRRADQTALVKVLDFGISKVTGEGGADLGMTKTNAAVLGSPLYMAPEQMRTMKGVDARTDIWSLGIILHELLSGDTPFTGTTLPELCAAILQDPPPSITAKRRDVPPVLEQIIGRCLEKDPARRYPDVAAFAIDLRPFASISGQASVERITGVYRAAGFGTSSPPPRDPGVSALAHTVPLHQSAPPPPGGNTTGKAWSAPPPALAASGPGPSTPPPPKPLKRRILGTVALGIAGLLWGAKLLHLDVGAHGKDGKGADAGPRINFTVMKGDPEPTVHAEPEPVPSAGSEIVPAFSIVIPGGSIAVPAQTMPKLPPPPPVPAVPPAAKPKVDCTVPYDIVNGERKWKRECLKKD